MIASPLSTVADGTSASNVKVTLRDSQGNPISGKSVSLTSSRGTTDIIAPVFGTTDRTGQENFSVKSIVAGSAISTAKEIAALIPIPQTKTVSFTAGMTSASESSVIATPHSLLADDITPSTIAVTLQDSNKNPV